MTNTELIKYAHRFLSQRQGPALMPVAEQAAAFAAQLRAGCRQDLIRLIEQLIPDMPKHVSGRDALRTLISSMSEGSAIDSWGMPDCDCRKKDCVYCSTGLAIPPARKR